jgi:Rne/Rng family ribonuclease
MKGRVLLIGLEDERASAAALIVDGRLEDLLLDPLKGDQTPVPGEVWRATVDRLVPNAGGAFVRLGKGIQGYLREAKGLREGASLLVQVISHAEGGKAAPVTRRVLYKRRLVIHTPDAPGINVSRQIRDEAERARLTAAVEASLAERGDAVEGGFIIRSAASGAPEAEIAAEVGSTLAMRASAEAQSDRAGPRVAQPAYAIAMRDWTDPLPDRIIVDRGLHRILARREAGPEGVLPDQHAVHSVSLQNRVEAADADGAFAAFEVADEIAALSDPRAPLPSGGWLSVEPTSALVAVDVNTGGDFTPAAGLKANIEAARDLPRQLRLRGLGGQIVVDFAPMPKKERKRLEDTLKAAFRRDPVETSLAGWTTSGLFELQRKRERRPLSELLRRGT